MPLLTSKKKKDIDFLKEMKERLEKWRDNNDWSERDMVFNMIDDWINELENN